MQRLLLFLAGLALDLYYRRETFGGRVPADGPTILVANHPNGLVDPVLLARTTRRPVRFLGKAPLFDMPVIGALMRGFQALPVYRRQDGADTALNATTFEAVFDALDAGELVCLFPEGKSHDEPGLQDLRTGAARMALGAEARRGFGLGVRILPIGLVYPAKRRFRSRVATCVGRPIELAGLAELHARDEVAAVRELTDRIAAGLRDVTLSLERWEDLPLIELAATVWSPRGGGRLTLLHEFAAGVRLVRERDPERLEALTRRVVALRDRLRALGLGAENLHARYRPRDVAGFLLRNVGVLFLAPVAALGAVLWTPPYLLAPLVPRWMRTSRDLHATVQILTGFVLFPLWWALLGAAAWALGGADASAAALVLAPLAGLAALALRDWHTERADDVRAFFLLGLRRRRLRELLALERDEIARAIDALRSELGLDEPGPPADAGPSAGGGRADATGVGA